VENTNIYKVIVPKINMMVYVRSKKIKGKTYYYIVEGKLDKEGKVKQKVLMYLGNIDNILRVFEESKIKN
jgi:hypothetical protein